MSEFAEIESKLLLAKRQNLRRGYLYTWNGDSPGIAETLDEVGKGRTVLGEIGKNCYQKNGYSSDGSEKIF